MTNLIFIDILFFITFLWLLSYPTAWLIGWTLDKFVKYDFKKDKNGFKQDRT